MKHDELEFNGYCLHWYMEAYIGNEQAGPVINVLHAQIPDLPKGWQTARSLIKDAYIIVHATSRLPSVCTIAQYKINHGGVPLTKHRNHGP